jgi:antitoxin MazE
MYTQYIPGWEKIMRTQISKWGNSLGIRIPKGYAEEMGLSEGASVDLKVSGRKLALVPAQPKYTLEKLLAGITRKNRHREAEWGAPQGEENW